MSMSIITVAIEPSDGSSVSYLQCAPTSAGNNELGIINLYLAITNNGTGSSSTLHITQIQVSVDGVLNPIEFATDLTIAAGQTVDWLQPVDYGFLIPDNPRLVLRFTADGLTHTITISRSLVAHQSPTPEGSYRFWGEVRDLRPGEFWAAHGTSHAQTIAQLFAYDVGVGVDDHNQPGGYDPLLPGGDASKNEDYRIWNKPIYAIADGEVTDFRHYFPTNPVAGQKPAELEMFWTSKDEGGLGLDGNGNFFTITGGTETILYAHMRTNSLNPKFLAKGAVVKKGDFLGLAGNSGSSTGPHMHIHANRINLGPKSWDGIPRPMPFWNAQVIDWISLRAPFPQAPWVRFGGRGIPPTACAIWPSDRPVAELRNVALKHFTMTFEGKLWAVTTSNRILTTDEQISRSGVFLNFEAGGAGKEIAFLTKPYVIGMDDKLWEGTPEGWVPVAGSPRCLRLTGGGKLWMIDMENRIRTYDPNTKVWAELPGNGRGKDICVLKGQAYLIGTDDRIWKHKNGAWNLLAGAQTAKRIADDEHHNKLWIVDLNNRIWSSADGGEWIEHSPGGLAKEIFIHQGTPYVIGTDDRLYKSGGKFGWGRMNVVEPK